jgi:hypothetical protein
LSRRFFATLDEVNQVTPQLEGDVELDQYDSIFRNIFRILEMRVQELESRWDNPGQWKCFSIEGFKEEFKKFFYTLEKSSKGRYRIIYNIADQEERDYLVQFK